MRLPRDLVTIAQLSASALLLLLPLRATTVTENNYAVTFLGQCGTQNAYGFFGTVYSASCSTTVGGVTLTGTAKSDAPGLGVAEAYASLTSTGTGSVSSSEEVYATTWSFDTWKNTASIPVNLEITVSVDVPPGGGISISPILPGGADGGRVSAGCLVGSDEVFVPSYAAAGAPQCTASGLIGAGQTVDIAVGINTTVTLCCYGSLPPVTLVSNYLGSADLTGVTVTDTNGHPLSPSLIQSSNSTLLTSNGYASTTPEPGTVLLAGAALFLGFVRRPRSA